MLMSFQTISSINYEPMYINLITFLSDIKLSNF
jgi:hypothetical protein